MQHKWEGKFKESWYLKINKRKFNEKTICRSGQSPEKNAHSELGCHLLFLKWAAAGYWNQPTQLGPCRHGNTQAGCAGVAQAQWGSSKTQKHFWLQIREVFCFLFFVFYVCWEILIPGFVVGYWKLFPTYNKPWPKGPIVMQISSIEGKEVFNRQITNF